MEHRTCSKCGVSKPETSEFFGRRGTPDRGGLRPDCLTCKAQRDREYNQRNQAQIRARRAEYRRLNAARIAVADAAYQRTPAGKAVRARALAKWAQSDRGREIVREKENRRRALRREALADLTEQDWADSLAMFGGCCAYCGAGGAMTVDHVVPFFSGGHHTRLNVVPACKSCNSSKFHHELVSWFTAQPFFDPERLARIRDYVRGAHAQAVGADQRD